MNQTAAHFVVVPLLLLRVHVASRFVEFAHERQRSLGDIVGDFALQQGLIEIEFFEIEVLINGRKFLKYSAHHDLRF